MAGETPSDAVDIKALAKAYTSRAIEVIVGVMENAEAPSSARLQAADALLDRAWGKPKQESEVKISVTYLDLLHQFDEAEKKYQKICTGEETFEVQVIEKPALRWEDLI